MLAALAWLRDGIMGERSELIQEDVRKKGNLEATSKIKNKKM